MKEGDMADVKREFGIVGLGRMGANLSLQALEKGIRVVGFDLKGVSDELKDAGMVEANSLEGFRDKLSPARPLFIYIPAGPVVDQVIDDIVPHIDKGDIIVDAGN
jgi:6-phosphogluconate dehydrogenase